MEAIRDERVQKCWCVGLLWVEDQGEGVLE